MKILLACLLAGAATVAGCARVSGESQQRVGYDFGRVERVAVVDVIGMVIGEAVKDQIGDFFALELLKKGYAPVERSQVQAILKEQKFQSSETTSILDAVRAGKILNVSAVILVTISGYADKISITAEMLEVENGTILWQATGYGGKSRDLAMISGAGSGAQGAVAGQALTPRQAEEIQRIVKRMCVQLPTRVSF